MKVGLSGPFDWSLHTAGYGAATNVPEVVLDAATQEDPHAALGLLERILCHACVDGVLNESTPHFAALLIDAVADGTAGSPWPFFDVLRTLVEGYHAVRGHIGHPPLVMATPFPAIESAVYAISCDEKQAYFYDSTIEVLRRRLPAIMEAGRSPDRVVRVLAISIEALLLRTLHEKQSLLRRISADLTSESNARTFCGLLTTHWIVAGDAAALPAADLPERATALNGSAAERTVALGLVTALGLLQRSAPVLSDWQRGVLRESLQVVAESGDEGYGWHRELVAGDVLHAIARSRLSETEQAGFFECALGVDPGETARVSVAALAAFYVLRRKLYRHQGRRRLLGPEDLTGPEREALELLNAAAPNWQIHGSGLLSCYGIPNFSLCGNAILGNCAPLLLDKVEGAWMGRLREASRWTWLRSPLDVAPRYSEEQRRILDSTAAVVVQGLTIEAHVDLALLLCEHVELPYTGVFRRLLERLLVDPGLAIKRTAEQVMKDAPRESDRAQEVPPASFPGQELERARRRRVFALVIEAGRGRADSIDVECWGSESVLREVAQSALRDRHE